MIDFTENQRNFSNQKGGFQTVNRTVIQKRSFLRDHVALMYFFSLASIDPSFACFYPLLLLSSPFFSFLRGMAFALVCWILPYMNHLGRCACTVLCDWKTTSKINLETVKKKKKPPHGSNQEHIASTKPRYLNAVYLFISFFALDIIVPCSCSFLCSCSPFRPFAPTRPPEFTCY